MNARDSTIDFGASTEFGAHVFAIDIPASRTESVTIVERYGYRGQEAGIPQEEPRVVLARRVWSAIAESARRAFNERLKSKRLTVGRWHSGTNLIERLLGEELCVLAWAAETATDDQLPVVCSKWEALRPEERWWLFSMTVAEAGFVDDTKRGWRRALFHALSDGEKPADRPRPSRPTYKDAIALPLFNDPE